MSKDKKLRKIVMEKLFHKNENPMKQSTRSNAPTESTPNEPKNFSKAIENFFENFEAECAIIYEPVKVKDPKPLKRSLQEELASVYRNDGMYRNERRLIFKPQDHQRLKTSMSYYGRNPSNINKKISNYQASSKAHIQSSNCQSKSKQNKSSVYTHAAKESMSKSKSMVFNYLSTYETQRPHKQKNIDSLHRFARESYLQYVVRADNPKQPQKHVSIHCKQDSQYLTNSKYEPSKYALKNAPLKPLQKPQRIRRIQSLKNLNQNGIRKYSYKREL